MRILVYVLGIGLSLLLSAGQTQAASDAEIYSAVRDQLGSVTHWTRAEILTGERDYLTERHVGGWDTRCYQSPKGVLFAWCTTESQLQDMLYAINVLKQNPTSRFVLQGQGAFNLHRPVFLDDSVCRHCEPPTVILKRTLRFRSRLPSRYKHYHHRW